MDILDWLVGVFAQNGYIAVAIALLICSVGVPLPEDITLVAGGAIAGLGYVNVHVMALIGIASVLAGDLIVFCLGRGLGPRVLCRWPISRILTPSRYALVQEKFDRYGNSLVFGARFLPGLRSAVFLFAGLTQRISVWRFLLLDGLAAVISVPLWVYLGYVGAGNRELMMNWLHRGHAGIWLVVAVAVVVVLMLFYWRRHRSEARTRP